MKKHFNTILILFLIVVFPLGSYLYMRSGFNYRKDILSEIEAKGKYQDILKNDLFGPDKKQTLLLVLLNEGDENKIAKLSKVLEQFKANQTLKVVGLKEGMNQDLETAFNTNFDASQGVYLQNLTADIIALNKLDNKNNAMLIDTASMIRSYYNLNEKDAFNKLINHIPAVLPREIEQDIILERDKEK